jgi:hypothetical protein
MGLLCLLFLAMLIAASASADASRLLKAEEAVTTTEEIPPCRKDCPPPFPPPDGQIEGACGVAVGSDGIYISDYYHRAIDVFGELKTQILAQPVPDRFEIETEGPCGLAFDGSDLFVNYWHQRVVRSTPPYDYGAVETIDDGESTGVAVDPASGDVYVNDRTSVAVYEAPVVGGEPPARIVGLGSLADAYGVAVAAGRVYVPDAADNTVKVYEPAVDLADPVLVIDSFAVPRGGFSSLVDAAVAIDPTNGHLVVLDNLQRGFEHPEAAIEEFDPSGAYLGRACGAVIDGEPSGLAFEPSGALLVTNGNDERANVSRFGAYSDSSSCSQPAGFSTEAATALESPPALVAGVAASAPTAAGGRPSLRRHRHRHRARQTGRHRPAQAQLKERR